MMIKPGELVMILDLHRQGLAVSAIGSRPSGIGSTPLKDARAEIE